MSKAAAKKVPKKKGANGYKLPEPIPKGEILTDLKKQRWIIGSSIGVGGFGEIYAAAPYKDKNPSEYSAVIKIEPHGNGPLFVEMHFYMRNASVNDISKWKHDKKIANLGMPPFLGSGSHECNGQKYRFIVMERYGTDLWKLFLENGRKFPEHTVYKVAWQIINVLEYIHNKTYVHADIKGANLLLDMKLQNQIFLVDFGLASHYTTKDEYKLDPKKAHNGTIEYTSRDAHMGVPTMRGDFEILLYNMIQWLCGYLPWEKNLKDPASVQQQKEKAFNNVQKYLKECFTLEVPTPISQFMTLLASMKYNDTPNYNKFRDILTKGLEKLNHRLTDKLELSIKDSDKLLSTSKKKKVADDENKSTPIKSKITSTAKSPRVASKRNTPARIRVEDSTLNNSIDSVVLDEKCIKGKDMRKHLIEFIDGEAEYEVQIKKRKTKPSISKNETPSNSTPKRGLRKKTEKQEILSDSEPEVIRKGTKSRPTPTARSSRKKSETKKRISLNESACDSDKDMFEESIDD